MRTLSRLDDKARLLRRLQDVTPGSPHRWGSMSAHQMVCHLSDSFRMALGRRPVSRACGPTDRTLRKWLALYAPVPWPAGIRTSPELDQELGGTRPVAFEADMAELERLLELVTAPKEGFAWPLHPIFGPLSGPAWLRWGYLHTDHHLRQFGA